MSAFDVSLCTARVRYWPLAESAVALHMSAFGSRANIKVWKPDTVASQHWPPNWSVARFECSDNVLYHLEIERV